MRYICNIQHYPIPCSNFVNFFFEKITAKKCDFEEKLTISQITYDLQFCCITYLLLIACKDEQRICETRHAEEYDVWQRLSYGYKKYGDECLCTSEQCEQSHAHITSE
jgi:hypothetical protein